MSFKSRVLKSNLLRYAIKLGIKLTPKILTVSIANIVLKGIAEFSTIVYDLDERTTYVKFTLYGEEESVEVALNGFEITGDKGRYQFILHNAQSNKPWMNNILVRIVGKSWGIPAIPQYGDEIELVADLLKFESSEKVAKKNRIA